MTVCARLAPAKGCLRISTWAVVINCMVAEPGAAQCERGRLATVALPEYRTVVVLLFGRPEPLCTAGQHRVARRHALRRLGIPCT